MANNPYESYANVKAYTATPGQLTLMLYDGAIKFCNLAIAAVEKKKIEVANTNIKKVEAIIDEFRATLDFKYPVAEDFDNVYKYLSQRLVEANLHKDKAILEEVLRHLRAMRDTWAEIMRAAK